MFQKVVIYFVLAFGLSVPATDLAKTYRLPKSCAPAFGR